MSPKVVARDARFLIRLTGYWLCLFLVLLVLSSPKGAGASPGSLFNQSIETGGVLNPLGNLGAVEDDKYWKDFFKTNELTGSVKALVKDNNGNVYVGGQFTTAGGVTVNRIAKWDGANWSALGSGVGSTKAWFGVQALVVDNNGILYAGGVFTTAGGVTVNNIAKWDGTQWSALGSGFTGTWDTVNALAIDDAGNLYAGGNITNAGGVPVANIAKWDGTSWSALGSGLSGNMGYMSPSVYALAWDGSNLYAGGVFLNAGGATANNIARWNGTAWSTMGGVFEAASWYTCVNVLAVEGTNLSVGGIFTAVGAASGSPGSVPANNIAKWDGSAWSTLGVGVNGPVFALARNGADLYAGGAFNQAGGSPAISIAKWNGSSSWSPLGFGIGSIVQALVVSNGEDLYVGGGFIKDPTAVGVFQANYLARWNGAAWSAVTGGDDEGVNSLVRALYFDKGGHLYVGGQFSTAGGDSSNRIARWNGSGWSALGSGVQGFVVNALDGDGNGNLYVGGSFSHIGGMGGILVNNIARWDGTNWSTLGSGSNVGVSSQVNALIVDGANLYAGGFFPMAGGVTVNRIAKWDGTAWSALGSGANVGISRSTGFAAVNAIALAGSNVYVGGSFDTAGGVAVNNIALWDGTAWSALGGGILNGTVYALAVDHSGNLFVGGTFTFNDADDVPVNNIALWDGSKWLALGTGVDSQVSALAFDGLGHLYVGGTFTTAGGAPANKIAKWDGRQWSALGSGMGGQVFALAPVSPGNLFVGGDFALAGGKSSAYVAQWTKALVYLPLVLK